MTKFVIALILAAAVIASVLVGVLVSRRVRMPPPDVLERVKQRNRELDIQERRERGD